MTQNKNTRERILHELKLVELTIRQTENIHARTYSRVQKHFPSMTGGLGVDFTKLEEVTSIESLDNPFKLQRRYRQQNGGDKKRSSLIQKNLKSSLDKTFAAYYTRFPDNPERFRQDFKLEMQDEILETRTYDINKEIKIPKLVKHYMDAR